MAGFNTAVTGLKSASSLLDVAGNNIANSSTVGFKSSRTEFGDIYATAVVGAGSSNTAGSGVTVTDIAQDFSGGTIEFTNSNLDLAINGSGFFQLDDGQGNITYTRAGAFELDKDGNIVSKNGKFLQGYGLDAQGNQLPIQNLSVTEKESPPKGTEQIDLSFNINSNANAEDLSRVFNRTDPGSYSYSTTVGTFDSLGNEHSIRFYFAEQRPVREVYEFNGMGTVDNAAPSIDFGGQAMLSDFNLDDIGALTPAQDSADPDTLYFTQATDGSGNWVLTAASVEKLQQDGGDPRIAADTVYVDDAGSLHFEANAEYTGYGDYAVLDSSGDEVVNALTGNNSERDSNEVQYLRLDSSLFTAGPDANLLSSPVTISVAGISIEVTDTGEKTIDDVGEEIATYEQEILDSNPDIESVVYNANNNRLEITWKADAGDVDLADVNQTAQLFTPDGSEIAVEAYKGDNSYVGVYRAYAFLNDTEQLNIGKTPDPGAGGAGGANPSEVGPILISFNSTTGVLEEVNGERVAGNGQAPNITILGADPANPEDRILDSDIDQLAGIQLDITDSSQFASESIVKSQQQDGYTKGDLIGVSFAETGEMVASYSNGQRANLGLVAVATFENQDGLQPSGNTEWIATLASGNAIVNPPGTGLNGTLRSAALEQSNVDLSEELVKLIEGQRNFQANSKTLETLNTVTQAILQI
ncbi:flagellar hook-basal body complex protein [Marinobacterium lutimaris]|uniref:Flagellar hook protein FlgE n=1 Tax=Marinobacterium lutimaris TaxID=568106 RepID=A0A1H6BD40_9GAMM|nr:flagellar hook-basal body complex protein [Marinobacterium lutimaris]SEG58733.1 flagellar hook-basal body protein [Marinobacterium lutimaris]